MAIRIVRCSSRCSFSTFFRFIVGFILFLIALLIILYGIQQKYSKELKFREASHFFFKILSADHYCSSDYRAISTCGCRADRRGYHQKVIGFSIYGNFSLREVFMRYVKAMERISDQVRLAYPDWIVRIYLTAENSRLLETIFGTDKHVDICVVESVLDESRSHLRRVDQLFPTIWRFLPLLDPMVDLFMSRDSDSYIIEREMKAVKEWLNSSFAFHVMRDHQLHCKLLFCTYINYRLIYALLCLLGLGIQFLNLNSLVAPMLAGMWGVNLQHSTFPNRWHIVDAATEIFQSQFSIKEMVQGLDQNLLWDYIWPIASRSLV